MKTTYQARQKYLVTQYYTVFLFCWWSRYL